MNIKRVQELSNLGRMHAAGLDAFALRKENRSGIYSYEQRDTSLPDEYEKPLRANQAAWEFFQRSQHRTGRRFPGGSSVPGRKKRDSSDWKN